MKLSAIPFATSAASCGEVKLKLNLISWPCSGATTLSRSLDDTGSCRSRCEASASGRRYPGYWPG